MNEVKLGIYTVSRRLPDGNVQHGLPFVAMSDDLAQKMVMEAMAKETHRIDLEAFDIKYHAAYYPDRVSPIVKAKSVRHVANVGKLFSETGLVIDGGSNE